MHLTTVMCLMIKEVIQRWRNQRFKRGTSRVAVAYVACECSFVIAV